MPDDFEYHDMLGSGGFGFVVKVKKKSTGKFFAMKLQTKMCMLYNTKCLDRGRFDELMLHVERSVMAECSSHPFITSLHYAFTTTTCAALVMDLASCGTLRQYLHHYTDTDGSPCGLPIDVVKQFIVEVAMGLNFLHERGVMYRDLKPANILLAADGHCLLCDFGLAGKIREKAPEDDGGISNDDDALSLESSSSTNIISSSTPSSKREPSCIILGPEGPNKDKGGVPATAPASSSNASEREKTAGTVCASSSKASSAGKSARRIRRKTSCGTVGYRPPEVVRERNLKYQDREGYDEASDWFSLGVTTYVLTCAKKPFQNKNNYTAAGMEVYEPTSLASDAHEMVPLMPGSTKKPSPAANFEFKSLMSKVTYGSQFSDSQVDFCERLIKRKAEHRMNYAQIMNHPLIENFPLDPQTLKARPCHPFILEYIREVWPNAREDHDIADPDEDMSGEDGDDEGGATGDEDDGYDNSNTSYRPSHSTFPWTTKSSKQPSNKSSTNKSKITPFTPRWANFEDLKRSIIKRVKETSSAANVEKEVRRWSIALVDTHDKLFDKWTYINKDDIELEMHHFKY
jgi:serine/threonine protein kinase